jgi:hypothetical protein
MKCLVCNDESEFAVMRIPFKCSCYYKNGNWSILDKNLFPNQEYPKSLIKFYEIFNQPDSSKREDCEKGIHFHKGCINENPNEWKCDYCDSIIRRCGARNSDYI